MDKISEFLSGVVNISDVQKAYEAMISVLGYKNSVNFCDDIDNHSAFDSIYGVVVDGTRYPFVGIKAVSTKDEYEIAKIHLKFWNRNDIPFSILVLPGEIRIYNNFTIKDSKLLYNSSSFENNLDLEDFCDDKIISNLFYEKLDKYIKKSERVDQRLLENLRTTIQLLYNKHSMDLEIAYNFLAQCIFVKYLEDRKIINLNSEAFRELKVKNFTELLEKKDSQSVAALFKILKYKFKGDIFDVVSNRKSISANQLGAVAQFFRGEDLNVNGQSQLSFFVYDFSIIPIELISNIYETFFSLGDQILNTKVAQQSGAYYTPHYLADFMVSSCFEQINCKCFTILDPACGSGVFLVSCYKRLVNAYLQEHGKITAKELSTILTDCIFGIDLNQKALKIAGFSLYIAMLDYLEPKDIYQSNAHLPTLKDNLICEDFLSPLLNFFPLKADLIIGNPPWVSNQDKAVKKYAKEQGASDQQTGQLFVLRACNFAHENTLISLIVPNSIFINKNAATFRQKLFAEFRVYNVLNLHWMKNSLFSNAKAPCTILTYQLSNNNLDYTFSYYSFRPNLIAKVLNRIVYNNAEIIKLKKTTVLKNEDIWYILTSGDDFDVRTISYLKEHPSLNEQMKDLKLSYGRGYAVGNGKEPHPEFLEYKGGNLDGCFESYFINYEKLPQITKADYERPRKLSFYQYINKLLIKRTYNTHTGRAGSTDRVFIFSDDFHQLADTTGQNKNLIYYLEALYNSELFNYYCFHCTKNAVSIKPEISKDNLLDFPVPHFSLENENISKICASVGSIKELKRYISTLPLFAEDALSHEEKLEELLSQLNNEVYALYDLSKVERETIDFTLNHVIPEYHSKTIGYPNELDYSNYVDEVCNLLNKSFAGSNYMASLRLLKSKNLFSIAIFDVSKDGSKRLEETDNQILSKLADLLGFSSLEMLEGEMIIKKQIIGFTTAGFYLIKTNEVRNWTMMSAIKDVNYILKYAVSSLREVEI